MASLKIAILKVFGDLFCVFMLLIPLWVYNLLHVVPLNRQGFFCSDTSIRYPYRSSTISSVVLFVSGFGFLILYTGVVEFYIYYKAKKTPPKDTKDHIFNPLLVGLYRIIGYFMIGGCINQFITDIGKESVGRPRPHFIDMCQPNVTCTAANQYEYIFDYECTRTSHPEIPASKLQDRMDDARKSLPSGHASFAAYTAIFLILYLELRLKRSDTRIFKQLFQCGVAAWAVWVGCSRVADFKHRYSDVVAGFVLGGVIAALVIFGYNKSLSLAKKKKKASLDSTKTSRHDETNGMLHLTALENNTTNQTTLNHVTEQNGQS